MPNNKEIAISFLENAATGRLDEAYNSVTANFLHHNAYFKGDADSLIQGSMRLPPQLAWTMPCGTSTLFCSSRTK